MSKKLSVVIPVHNEEPVLEELHHRLTAALGALGLDWSVFFVNDGSTDKSLEILNRFSKQDPRFRIIDFSRNFGHQAAITAGMDHADGDACVVMDADLQDPPELIGSFVRRWQEGFEVVYATRTERKGEGLFKRITANIFYRVMKSLMAVDIPTDTGDFRLLDRIVVERIRELREHHRLLRGLVSWIGFRQTSVPYARDARFAGKSHYSIGSMFGLAFDGMTSFSLRPLQFATLCGLVFFLAGVGFGLTAWIHHSSSWARGLFTLVLLLGGLQLMTVGLLGEYIGRIFTEAKDRPLYVIRSRTGFPERPKNTL